ncbi:hypothetical protein, partial [Klebsiella pneumoniae]
MTHRNSLFDHEKSPRELSGDILEWFKGDITAWEVAIKWSAAPDMTPQTVLYRRPVAQFSNFQPKIVSSWL